MALAQLYTLFVFVDTKNNTHQTQIAHANVYRRTILNIFMLPLAIDMWKKLLKK